MRRAQENGRPGHFNRLSKRVPRSPSMTWGTEMGRRESEARRQRLMRSGEWRSGEPGDRSAERRPKLTLTAALE